MAEEHTEDRISLQESLRKTVLTKVRRFDHLSAMDQKPPSRRDSFAQWMATHELNAYKVAKKAGVPYTTLASFMQGETRSLKGDTEGKVAAAFETTVNEIFESGPPGRVHRIPVVGYVGAAAEFVGFDEYAQGSGFDEIDAPPDAPDTAVAVVVRGDSGYPLIRDGMTLVYWDKFDDPRLVLGENCFVRLRDGRTLVKIIEQGTERGRWTLNSINAATPPIRNVEIEWAAPIEHIIRGRSRKVA